MYFKFLDGKEKNKASGLISGQKYDDNNLFIYVQNLNLFLFIIIFLLVRMRFHLHTLFEILRRIALWSA